MKEDLEIELIFIQNQIGLINVQLKMLESIHQGLSKAYWSSEIKGNILGASESLLVTVANLVAMKASLSIRELKLKILLS